MQEFIDRYNGRPRRKKPTHESEEDGVNPLCESNKPDCLGPQSEFCCRACRKLRDQNAEPTTQDEDEEPEAYNLDASAETATLRSACCVPPGSPLQAHGCPSGVIPPAQYPGVAEE